ncbi:hypothetical protein SCOR_02710 [Sulfidibacter corallicola]|uniref:Uncharacterized protein n=1 Tax=Sulfidibacter corallicola TaxID=2818388 RepID=A0A8A4TEM6_SULCO|nr:hypothetical protein [Sulfidibacter corallicola]QTD48559.1 hypothetical protein J3U87_23510 [Sulfidibacter corallicola]
MRQETNGEVYLSWIERIIKFLPHLKTRIQLTGLVVAISAGLILQLVAPGNIPALICATSGGVAIIIFGQVFQFIHHFPENQRAFLVLGLFFFFTLLEVSLAILLVSLIVEKDLNLISPENGQSVYQEFEVNWDPPHSALVTILRGGKVVESTNNYVSPPTNFNIPPSDQYDIQVRTRFAGSAIGSFSVVPDPKQRALESIYLPEKNESEAYIEGTLEIPEGYGIDAILVLDTTPPIRVRIFGRGDSRTRSRTQKVYAGATRRSEICVYDFMQIPHNTRQAVTMKLSGVIIDRLNQRHHFQIELTVDFRNELSSVSLIVGFDGTVFFHEVPG